MKKKIISAIQYIFFLLIGLVLLYLVFRKVALEDVMNEVRNAHYGWLLFSIFFGILSHISRAYRWNILIRSLGYETKTSTTFYAVMTGYLANAAFPRLGEVTKCAVLSKKTNIPFNKLFGTVISERIFDLFTLITIILMVIILQFGFLREFVDKYVLSALSDMMGAQTIAIGVLIIILIISLPILLYKIFIDRMRELSIYKRVKDFVMGLIGGIATIRHMKHKGAFLMWTGIIWLNYILMTYVAFFALDATSHLTFGDSITLMALGSLGIVAPVPGGIGAYQFIVKAILVEIYALASEPAASFSMVLWTTQTILILFAGVLSYYMIVVKKSESNEKITA